MQPFQPQLCLLHASLGPHASAPAALGGETHGSGGGAPRYINEVRVYPGWAHKMLQAEPSSAWSNLALSVPALQPWNGPPGWASHSLDILENSRGRLGTTLEQRVDKDGFARLRDLRSQFTCTSHPLPLPSPCKTPLGGASWPWGRIWARLFTKLPVKTIGHPMH